MCQLQSPSVLIITITLTVSPCLYETASVVAGICAKQSTVPLMGNEGASTDSSDALSSLLHILPVPPEVSTHTHFFWVQPAIAIA